VFGWADRATRGGGGGSSGAAMLGLPALPPAPLTDEWEGDEVADKAAKAKAALKAQERLIGNLVRSTYDPYKATSSIFRPFGAPSMGGGTAGGRGTAAASSTRGGRVAFPPTGGAPAPSFDRSGASTLAWRTLTARSTFRTVVAPLSGARARGVLTEVLTSLSCSSLMLEAMVETVRIDVSAGTTSSPTTASAAAAAAGAAGLASSPAASTASGSTSVGGGGGESSGSSAAGPPSPFPIVLNASELASPSGLANVLQTVYHAFAPFAGKPYKQLMKALLTADNPHGVMFRLLNVLDNRPPTASGAPTAAAADSDANNPPVLMYKLAGGGAVPAYMYSPEAALVHLDATAAMESGLGGGYGGGGHPGMVMMMGPGGMPVPVYSSVGGMGGRGGAPHAAGGSEAASEDPWTTARRQFEGLRSRRRCEVSFLDLARGMAAAVGEAWVALDALPAPDLEVGEV
jgi:hypothetical protein